MRVRDPSSRPECLGGFQTHTVNLLYFYPIAVPSTFSLPLLTPLWQGTVLRFLGILMLLPAVQPPTRDALIIVKVLPFETVWINNELKCHACA